VCYDVYTLTDEVLIMEYFLVNVELLRTKKVPTGNHDALLSQHRYTQVRLVKAQDETLVESLVKVYFDGLSDGISSDYSYRIINIQVTETIGQIA
jgi:hypothetical protein